jgi:ComF family protein
MAFIDIVALRSAALLRSSTSIRKPVEHCQLERGPVVYKFSLSRLIPERCLSCGGRARRGFCGGCRAEFLPLEAPQRPIPGGSIGAVASIVTPYTYADPLKSHIHALKFSGARLMGRALGTLLVEQVVELGAAANVDAVVAVPLHRSRFLERGYNQAVEIARPVAGALQLPLLLAGIRRQRHTRPQSDLSAAERRANVAGAFSVGRTFRGLRIAVIDDVVTTGATVTALAQKLLRAQAAAVCVWAVARSA